MSRQLPLHVRLRDAATFEGFEVGANGEPLAWLRQALAAGNERGWLWGLPGSGRSHLLQAACHAVEEAGGRAICIAGAELLKRPEALLDGLEHCQLVAIDDVEVAAGQRPSEEALFALYNAVLAHRGTLLFSAAAAPLALHWRLPDLASRLAASTVYRLQRLADEQKVAALLRRARVRGLQLNASTARYILSHFDRDTHALFALLDDLDLASLSAQRRVTVPFVRELLAQRRAAEPR